MAANSCRMKKSLGNLSRLQVMLHHLTAASLQIVQPILTTTTNLGFQSPHLITWLQHCRVMRRLKAEATIPLVPGRDEDFMGRDDFDDAEQLRIGSDGTFTLTFFIFHLFPWIL
uniref:Uncharacterized protein n=1 Tax=Urocitellus parryii TaxID=9999 RepID=A0A8D2KEJ2_UROPR